MRDETSYWPTALRLRARVRAAVAAGLALALAAGAVGTPDRMSASELLEVFPGAERAGAMEGRPPAAPVYRQGRLAGYVFHSRGAVESSGYSGRPIDVLIGLGLDGVIVGVRLVEQHEPILAVGVDEAALRRFIDQHRGLDIRNPARPGRRAGGTLDAMSGATVSSLVINDAIFRAARAVARSRGLLGGAEPGAIDPDYFEKVDWAALLADGSISHRRVASPAAAPDQTGTAVLIDLFAALANPPRIGRNLLGDRLYGQVMAGLAPGDAAILLAANGLYSFKGTSFARTGEFDRFRIVQDNRPFRLRVENYRRLDALAGQAPEFRELGLFVLPAAGGFDAAAPWRLELTLTPSGSPEAMPFTVSVPYEIPKKYLGRASASEAAPASGRAAGKQVGDNPSPEWLGHAVETGLVALAAVILTLTGLALVLQRRRAAALRVNRPAPPKPDSEPPA